MYGKLHIYIFLIIFFKKNHGEWLNGPGVFEQKEGKREGKKRGSRQERKKVKEKYTPCWGQEFVKNAI